VLLTGQLDESLHGIGSQRSAALHAVSGFAQGACAEQPGTQAPLEHTPRAQSALVAHFTQAWPTQRGLVVGQSLSSAHSTHCRKLAYCAGISAQAGRAAGQSVFVAH
jgi:hypothetical protein